ncbi:SUKH-4 family immunity protein [Streptomyces sp. NPDC052040]|uniref:SUKH-4 family immunity protein n=1 Tax=Streptomyces sp. NPDC052040 TaxID=3365682 RepID=UPI0037D89922
MDSTHNSTELTAHIHSWASDASAEHNVLFVDGPSGAGKTEVLRTVARTTPETSLIDASGLSTEQVMDSVMQTLGVPYGDYRDADLLIDDIGDQCRSRVLLVANTQWAGQTRSTAEPRHLTSLLVRGLGSPYRKSGVKVVLEVSSDAHPLGNWFRSPLTLPPRPRRIRSDIQSLPSPHRAAVKALALAELRSVSFREWRDLCSALGAHLKESELQEIAADLNLASVDESGTVSVSLNPEFDTDALREQIPHDESHAFHDALVDRMFTCAEDDPLTGYLARALPAHAAVAGRFEELSSTPHVLAKCAHTALFEALPVAFPDGVPAGTRSADLHYLDALGVAPSSHTEWLSLLHLLALSQGDVERARMLMESAAAPLPWHTVWTHWRAPGCLRFPGTQTDAVESLRTGTADSTITSTSENGQERTWDAATGHPIQPAERDPEAHPHSSAPPHRWQAEPSWNLLRLRLATAPDDVRTVQAPALRDAACTGDLVVLGGDRGVYAIKPDVHYRPKAPLRALPAVGPRVGISPRPYDEAACRPTRERVLQIWAAEHVPTIPEEHLPAGLTHEPTRRFLSQVGFPAVSDFYSLNTHHLADTGLAERGWEGGTSFNTSVGNGPFYELGTWIGGVLLLDGPTGRVLRLTQPSAIDSDHPGEPLAGSSLAQFVAAVSLQWEYMLAYTTSGGLDSADLLAELTSWLSKLDPAAAQTQNWGHVLDPDNFSYL